MKANTSSNDKVRRIKEIIDSSKPKGFGDLRPDTGNYAFSFINWCLGRDNSLTRKDVWDFEVYLPDYDINLQRSYGQWNQQMKQDWIKSILDRDISLQKVIINRIYCGKNYDVAKYEVIDGQHRLLTISEFVKGEFKVCYNGEKFSYSEIEMYFERRLARLIFEVYDTDGKMTDEMKIHLYLRTNFGGAAQSIEKKNQLENALKKNGN